MRFLSSRGSVSLCICQLLLPLLAIAQAAEQPEADHPGFTIEKLNDIECKTKTKKFDTLQVEYTGWFTNGTKFESSEDTGVPLRFAVGLGNVIKGFELGLLDMCVGEKRKLTIPPELAYGHEKYHDIPANSTLIFDTELMKFRQGFRDGDESYITAEPSAAEASKTAVSADAQLAQSTAEASDGGDSNVAAVTGAPSSGGPPGFGILTAPAARPTGIGAADKTPEEDTDPRPNNEEDAAPDLATTPPPSQSQIDSDADEGECHLLGPFAIVVQAGLGVLALFSLVWKRYREKPRRPVKVWFFDASKQVVGAVLLHVANLLMSMFSVGDTDLVNKAKQVSQGLKDSQGDGPNPCSLYLINLAIDTTVGIPVLVILLRLLHYGASLTPLARPPESIKSGHYGQPPRYTWWLKQSIIYFVGLVLMKLWVLFILAVLPWLIWVGDWALRWTEGNTAVQIAFVMFIFPLIMNAIQYYIIDTFIKDNTGGGDGLPMGGPGEVDASAYEPLRHGGGDDEDDADGAGALGQMAYEDEDEAKAATSSAREVVPTPSAEQASRAGDALAATPTPADMTRRKERSE